jgi:hypothetical protein
MCIRYRDNLSTEPSPSNDSGIYMQTHRLMGGIFSRSVARQRLGKNPLIIARQRLVKNVTAVTNTHATVEKSLDASFSMWPVSYPGK